MPGVDRKSTRLNSSHEWISYAVFCLKKKKNHEDLRSQLQAPQPALPSGDGRVPAAAALRARPASDARLPSALFFFFNDTATTEIYTLSLHDALPILTPHHLLLTDDLAASYDPVFKV